MWFGQVGTGLAKCGQVQPGLARCRIPSSGMSSEGWTCNHEIIAVEARLVES